MTLSYNAVQLPAPLRVGIGIHRALCSLAVLEDVDVSNKQHLLSLCLSLFVICCSGITGTATMYMTIAREYSPKERSGGRPGTQARSLLFWHVLHFLKSVVCTKYGKIIRVDENCCKMQIGQCNFLNYRNYCKIKLQTIIDRWNCEPSFYMDFSKIVEDGPLPSLKKSGGQRRLYQPSVWLSVCHTPVLYQNEES